MQPKLDGPFQQWELNPIENRQALNSNLLLAYMQNKRAIYASGFVQNFITAIDGEVPTTKTIIDIERSRAHIQILDEIINEIVESMEEAHQELQSSNPQNPEASHF